MKKKNKKPTSLVSLLVVIILVIMTLIFVAKAIFLERDTFSLQENEASISTAVKEGINSRRLELMEDNHQLIEEEKARQRAILLQELEVITQSLESLRKEISTGIQAVGEETQAAEDNWLYYDMEAVYENINNLNTLKSERDAILSELNTFREDFSEIETNELVSQSEEVEALKILFTELESELESWENAFPETERWETPPDIMVVISNLSSDEHNDVVLMAEALFHEGGNTSEEEMLRIGSVIMNRTISEYYPDSIYAVLYDERWGTQYSSTSKFFTQEIPTECYEIAYRLVVLGERTSSFGSDVIGQTGLNLNLDARYFELVFIYEWNQYWSHK